MNDLPNFDILEFARRYLVVMMLADGMSPDVVERLISNMPHNNPLRETFSIQLIESLPKKKRLGVQERLLGSVGTPNIKVTIHTQGHGYAMPFSSHMNVKDIESLVARFFDTDRVKKKSKLRDN